MKILFISSIIPQEYFLCLQANSKVGIGGASDVFQKAVLQGLVENEADFDIISYPTLGCFPHNYKKIFTPQGVFEVANGKKGKLRRYCTILGIKEKSLQWRAKRDIGKWLKANNAAEEPVAVLTYNFDTPVMLAVAKLKKQYPKIVISTIVTDLVDNIYDFASNNSFFKRIQQDKLIKYTRKLYPVVNKYILLTAHMTEKIPDAKGKYIVVEGIAARKSYDVPSKNPSDIKSLLYTGVLEEFGGVKSLVDAFLLTTDPSFRLVICGSGILAKYIKEKALNDNRIIYKGLVSRDEALKLQRESTALINPRQPNGNITKYSFPSKTMEYLSSGTPMIGYRLEGISNEYLEHIYTVESLDIQALADKITEVLSKPQSELDQKAAAAMTFIYENKTAKIQVARIIDFIGL